MAQVSFENINEVNKAIKEQNKRIKESYFNPALQPKVPVNLPTKNIEKPRVELNESVEGSSVPFDEIGSNNLITTHMEPVNLDLSKVPKVEMKKPTHRPGRFNPHTPRGLRILDDGWDLCRETIKLCKSEKIIPKSARWLGANEIVNITQRFHTCLFTANNIKFECGTDYAIRRSYMNEARALLITLTQKFDFFMDLYNYDYNKLCTWIEKADKLLSFLNGWLKSDLDRYNRRIN